MRINIFVVAITVALLPSLNANAESLVDGQVQVTPGNTDGIFEAPRIELNAESIEQFPATNKGNLPSTRPVSTKKGKVPCRYVAASAEDAQTSAENPPSPDSRLYMRLCPATSGGWMPMGYRWLKPKSPEKVTPVILAQQAFAQLRLPIPSPKHSPDIRLSNGRHAVIVGEHTWLWTDGAAFSVQRKRIAAGTTWAEVTATPFQLAVDPGDGHPAITCKGPGTPFDSSHHHNKDASPDCDHVYRESSLGNPNNSNTVTYQIYWHVAWTGSTGSKPTGGHLPDMTSRISQQLSIAEVQALITK